LGKIWEKILNFYRLPIKGEDMAKRDLLTIRDFVYMSIFGAISATFVLTTPFFVSVVPVKGIPGFGGILYIPFSSAFSLIAIGLVGKPGSATITYTINGIISFLLPGGPGILILPMSIVAGLVIDFYLLVIHGNVADSRRIAASAAFLPSLITPWIMWWGMTVMYGRIIPLWIFLIMFLVVHGFLRFIGGLAAYYALKRVRGIIT